MSGRSQGVIDSSEGVMLGLFLFTRVQHMFSTHSGCLGDFALFNSFLSSRSLNTPHTLTQANNNTR